MLEESWGGTVAEWWVIMEVTTVERSAGVGLRDLGIVFAAAAAFALVLGAENRDVVSDPVATLLTSEQMLRSGTVRLDAYSVGTLSPIRWAMYESNGHIYNYFPLGSSIVAIPFVAIAVLFGANVPVVNPELQVFIAATLSALILLLMYALARMFVSRTSSLLLSIGFWAGTSLSSTGGTALWSHLPAVVLALVALLLLAHYRSRIPTVQAVVLGVVLFGAYISRPSMFVFVAFVLVVLGVWNWRRAVISGFTVALLFAAFVAWSWGEYARSLPPYYMPNRLAGGEFLTAIIGTTISPARGLLVFSPFLVLLPVLMIWQRRQARANLALLTLALGWPAVTVIVNARFEHWWGGFSYGSRLLTDIVPGLFLAFVLLWPAAFSNLRQAVFLVAAVALFAWSGYVHVVQGLYNPWVKQWNFAPDVDQYPEQVFNWSYPQFLHSSERHYSRLGSADPWSQVDEMIETR